MENKKHHKMKRKTIFFITALWLTLHSTAMLEGQHLQVNDTTLSLAEVYHLQAERSDTVPNYQFAFLPTGGAKEVHDTIETIIENDTIIEYYHAMDTAYNAYMAISNKWIEGAKWIKLKIEREGALHLDSMIRTRDLKDQPVIEPGKVHVNLGEPTMHLHHLQAWAKYKKGSPVPLYLMDNQGRIVMKEEQARRYGAMQMPDSVARARSMQHYQQQLLSALLSNPDSVEIAAKIQSLEEEEILQVKEKYQSLPDSARDPRAKQAISMAVVKKELARKAREKEKEKLEKLAREGRMELMEEEGHQLEKHNKYLEIEMDSLYHQLDFEELQYQEKIFGE